MAISSGKMFGRFRILDPLGAGGMGEVYLAEDITLHRKAAIKLLPENINGDKHRFRRFEQEALAASALNHPNILTVYEFGQEGETHFLATEFIAGATLRQKLKIQKISIREAMEIAVQITAALDAAHRNGIVHRDIKPENVMIRAEDGLVKVLDFGIAKLLEKKPEAIDAEAATVIKSDGTSPGMIIGTAAYMSPEQARGKEIDARSDIFSFGCVLYEMLSGKRAFAGETPVDVIGAILHKEPVSLLDDNEIPKELPRIAEKCLRKEREERYQTAKDLLIDLKDVQQELEFQKKLNRAAAPKEEEAEMQILNAATDEAVQPLTSNTETVIGKVKQNKFLFAAGFVILAAVISLGWWLLAARTASNDSSQINSIAVLPFENASGNADLDYLSDGVSESVIDRLSQLPQLKVIARRSSFRYRGQNLNLPEIANALGVQAIVTGRVVPRGDSYQIRVELVDVRDNKQLWGENFNRKASDVQILQADISREIAENLRLRLSGMQTQQLAEQGTTNPQAYEALQKGRYYINRHGPNNLNKATEYFEQAVAADPAYALAYAYLSEMYGFGGGMNLTPEQRKVKRNAAAMKAVELNPNLAEAHFSLGRLKVSDWEWEEAEREYKLAIELNPNLAKAHNGYARYLVLMGRQEEAVAEARRSIELDPLDFLAANGAAAVFRDAQRYEEAIEAASKALELEQNLFFTHIVFADSYAAKGMLAQAIAEYQEAIRLLGGNAPNVEALLGAAYVKMGERAKAMEILESLKSRASSFRSTPRDLAVLYDSLGMRDEAVTLLEKAFAERDSDLSSIRINPNYNNLRPDPRFQDLLRRMGLPQ